MTCNVPLLCVIPYLRYEGLRVQKSALNSVILRPVLLSLGSTVQTLNLRMD
jgi:hypothetical protein